MREYLNDFVGKISEVAETVGKKADEVLETQKIKNSIRGLEKNNRRDLRDLGRIVYEKYKKGEELEEEFLELCQDIKGREEEILYYETELERVKED